MANIALHYYRYHNEKWVEAISPSVIPYYDLTLVISGRLEYRINNKRVSVGENDAILISPGSKRERFRTEGKTTYVSFNFRTQEELRLPLLIEGAVGKEVRMMLYACQEMDRDHGAFARAAFEDMTSAILNAIRSFVTRSENSALTERILAFIRDRYRERLTLAGIAGEMAYSTTYCDQVFKKDLGVSVIRYLIDYRIGKVKELLIENALSLGEIAEATGFGDANYLSRQFRQRTGISPLRFRKQFNGQIARPPKSGSAEG